MVFSDVRIAEASVLREKKCGAGGM